MPDMFGGDTAAGATAIADDSTSLLEQIKLRAAEAAKSFVIDMWLARITPDKVMPVLHRVIEKAREEYAEAIRHGDGIYAVGYCVGARFVMLLAQENEKTAGDEESAKAKEGPYIKAGALAHAASVIPDDFKGIKAPLSFVCVENDPLFPDEVRSAGEDAMADRNLEHEVQVYPGVPHGKSATTPGPTRRSVDNPRFRRGWRISRSVHQGCTGDGVRADAPVAAKSLSSALGFVTAFILLIHPLISDYSQEIVHTILPEFFAASM